MDKDEELCRKIDSPMCFMRGDVSYLEPDDSEGGLGQTHESIYVKDTDEQIIYDAASRGGKIKIKLLSNLTQKEESPPIFIVSKGMEKERIKPTEFLKHN